MATPSTEDEKGMLGILGENLASAGSSVMDFGSSALDTVVDTVTNPLDSLQSFGETISDTSANLLKNTGQLLYEAPKAIVDARQDIQQSVTDWYTGTTNKPNDTIENLEKYKDDFKREKGYFAEGWKDVKELGAGLLFQANLPERLFGREDEQNLKETVDTKDYNQKIIIYEKGIGEEQSKFASLESDPRIERANNFYRNAQRNFELLNGKSAEKDPDGFKAYVESKFLELPAFEQQQVISQQTLKEQLAAEYQASVNQKETELATYLNEQSVDGKGADRYKEWKTEQENEIKDNETFQRMGKIRQEVEGEVDEAITKLNIEKLGSYAGFNNLREQMIDDAATYRQQELDIYYGDLPNAKEFARKAMELNDVKRKTDLKYLETFIKEKNDIENKNLTDLEISKKTATKTWNSLSADEQKKFADMETFITTLTTIQKSQDLSNREKYDPRQILDIASLWGNTVGTVSDKAFAELEGVPHYFNQETRNLIYANEGNLNKAVSVLTYNPDVIGSVFLSTLGVAGAGKVISKFSKTLGTAAEASMAKIPFKIGSTPGVLTFLGRNTKALTASQIYGAATDPILDNAMVQTAGPVNDAFNQITNVFFDMAVPAASMISSTAASGSFMGGKFIANNISYQFLNGDKKKAVQDMTQYLNSVQGIKTTPAKVNEMMKAVVEDMYPLMFNPKEFDEMINSQGGLYNFVSTSIKDMDQSNVGEMLTAKGISFKKIIPEILGVPKSVVTNFNEALTLLGKKSTDTKELVAKQFAAKKIVSELDTIKDAFEVGSSNGYRGVTLDKKKILTPEAQKEYGRLKTEGLNLINDIQTQINTTEIKSIDVQTKFQKLQQTIIDTQRKFGFNKKGVNQIEMILPAGNVSNPNGSFLIDVDKLEELQAGSFDELIKSGAITIKSDQVIDGKKFKKGNKIFMANQGHEGVLNGIAKHVKYDESIDNLANRLYDKIGTLVDITPKLLEKNLRDGFFNVVKGAGGTLSMSILKDPIISKNEELISEIMDDIASTFNLSLNNYFKKTSGIENALPSEPLKVNNFVANKETYFAQGEEIMNLMTSKDNYFSISYGYFKDQRTYSQDGFGNAIYLSLGNKTIKKLGDQASIVESFLNAHRDDSGKSTMRRINNNASQFKQMIFDFGFKDGKLDIEKGVSKATQVVAATDNSSLFTNGVFDKDKVRGFVTNNLDLKTDDQQKATQEIVDFMIDLFNGIDSGYEAISVPVGLSILYHYSKNKKLIDAAMQRLDNPEFKKIMSDILLAPDVTEQIAKRIKDSTRVDIKYKEAPTHLKKQVEREFQVYKDKLAAKKELFESEAEEIKSYLKGMGSGLSDLQKNKLNARLIEIDTKIKNVQAQLNKKASPIVTDTLELYNIEFLKQMSENFLTTKQIIDTLPVNEQERVKSLLSQKQTLQEQEKVKLAAFSKIGTLNKEEIYEVKKSIAVINNSPDKKIKELLREDLSVDQKEIITAFHQELNSKNKTLYSFEEIDEIIDQYSKYDDFDIVTKAENLNTTMNPYINYLSSFVTGNQKYFNDGIARSFNKFFTGNTDIIYGPKLYHSSEAFKQFIDSFTAVENKNGEVLFNVPSEDLSKPNTWKVAKKVTADEQKSFLKYVLRTILSDSEYGAKIITENGDDTLKALDYLMNEPALHDRFRKTLSSISRYKPSAQTDLASKIVEEKSVSKKDGTVFTSEALSLDNEGFVEGIIQIDNMIKAGMDISIVRELDFDKLRLKESVFKYKLGEKTPAKSLKRLAKEKADSARAAYPELKKYTSEEGKTKLLSNLQDQLVSPRESMYLFEKMFNAPRVKDPKPKELTQNDSILKQRYFEAAITDSGIKQLYDKGYTFVAGFGDKETGMQFYKAPKEIRENITSRTEWHPIQKEMYSIEYRYSIGLTKPNLQLKTFDEFKKGLLSFIGDEKLTLKKLKDFTLDEKGENKFVLSEQVTKKREASQMSNVTDFGKIEKPIDLYIIEKNNPSVDYYNENSPELFDLVLKYKNLKQEDLADMKRSDIAKLFSDYINAEKVETINGEEVIIEINKNNIDNYFRSSNDSFARNYKEKYFSIDENFNKGEYKFEFDKAKELVETLLSNDRDDGFSLATRNLIIERLQAQGFSKKDATEYVNNGTIREFKSHGIHDSNVEGQLQRFQAKTLFLDAEGATMNKGGKDSPLEDDMVFIGDNSAKIKGGVVKPSDTDPKYITRNGVQYKVIGKVPGATTQFFRNAASDKIDHAEESTFSSSIIASCSTEATLRISEMMTDHINDVFKNTIGGFLDGTLKIEAHSDWDKIVSKVRSQVGIGHGAMINKAIAKFFDEINYYMNKPKQPGTSTFLIGASDEIKPNEIILHEKSSLVEQTRKEVSQQLFGIEYTKLSDKQKEVVNKNLTTIGYRYPVSSKYSTGVFKIVLNTDDRVVAKYGDMGHSHVALNTETMYLMFKGDSDGDHSFFISGTGDWGDIVARDILRKPVSKKSPSFLEIYGDLQGAEDLGLKIKSAGETIENFVTIAKEVKKATETKEVNPSLVDMRMGSAEGKPFVGIGSAAGRTLKLTSQESQLANLIDNPDWQPIIKSLFGDDITKEKLLNRKFITEGVKDGKIQQVEMSLKDIQAKFPYLNSGKGFVESFGSLLNSLVDAGSSGETRLNPEWFMEFIGNAKYNKSEGFTIDEKIAIYEDYLFIIGSLSKNQNSEADKLNISNIKDFITNKNILKKNLGNKNWIFNWFGKGDDSLFHFISQLAKSNESLYVYNAAKSIAGKAHPELIKQLGKKQGDEAIDVIKNFITPSEKVKKFVENTNSLTSKTSTSIDKISLRRENDKIIKDLDEGTVGLLVMYAHNKKDKYLLRHLPADKIREVKMNLDTDLKNKLESNSKYTEEINLDEVFKNSSQQQKLEAEINLPEETKPTKENISLQIKKDELIQEAEELIKEPINSELDVTQLEFEIADIQSKIADIDAELSRIANRVEEEVLPPVPTTVEAIGGIKTDMYSLPDVDYKLVDEDVTKALNILSMYDDVEFRHNKKIALRLSTIMEQYMPDVAAQHSFLASFLNQGDIVPNAMAVYINHFGKKLISNGDGLKSIIMDSVENPKLQGQIIKSVLKNTFEFDTVAKEFRVKSKDEILGFMNLEERKFNMENIDKLNQKLDDYLKDIANPLLKKINFLQSQGIDIKTGYKNTMETLVPDFLEAHKSDAQIAFKTLGFHNEEQIFDRFKQVLKTDKLSHNQRTAARIVIELFLRKKGDTASEVIKSVLTLAKLQHYSMTYGTASWITQNGIGAAVSQMLPNFMEVIAYRRGHDLKNAKRIAEDYDLLASESSIKFGSGYANELNSNSILDDAFQSLSNTLSGVVNGNKAPSMPTRFIHAMVTNPMGATDALIEGTRKQVAIQSAMDRFGIKDAADFDRKVRQHGKEFLASFENQARINYADSGGGVISSSQLYRETLFNHLDKYFIRENGTPIPVVYHIAKVITGGLGYLSGWAYHKTATMLEHGTTFMLSPLDWKNYGLKNASANVKDSIIYLESQVRLVGTSVGLFLKINKYENDDSNIASFDDFMKAVNNTFVSLEMMFGGRLERNILLADKDAGFSKSLGYNVYQEYLNIGRLFKQKKFLDDVWTHYQATDPSKRDIFNSFQFGMQVHYSGFIRGVGAERTNDEYEIAASNSKSALLLIGSTTQEEKILSDIQTQRGLATYGELGLLGSISRNLLGNPVPYAVLTETREELMKAMIDDKDIGKLYKGGQLGTGANDYNIALLYGKEGTKITSEQAERLKDAWYTIEASTLLQADDLGEKDKSKNRTAEQDKYRAVIEKALAKEGKSLDYFVEAYANPRVEFKPFLRELADIESKYGIPQSNITAMIILQDYKNAQSAAAKVIQKQTGSFKLTDREALELKRDVLLRNQTKLNGDFSFVELVGNQHAVMKHKDILERMIPLVETNYNMDWEYQKVSKSLATMNRISQTIRKDTSVAKLNTPYAQALSGVKDTQEGVDIVNTAIFKIYRTPSLTNKEKLANVAALVHGLSKKTFAVAKENDNFMTITEDSRKLLANVLYSTLSSAEQYDSNSTTNSFNRYSSGGYTQKYRGPAREGARPNFSKQFEPVKKMLEPLIQYVDKNPDKYVSDRNPYKDDNYINPLQFPYVREQYRLRIQTIYDGYLSKGIIKQRAKEKEVDSFKKETINLKRVKKVKDYKLKKQSRPNIKKHLKGLNPNLELGYSTEK